MNINISVNVNVTNENIIRNTGIKFKHLHRSIIGKFVQIKEESFETTVKG